LGCGILFESDKAKAVYFCRNGVVMGRIPLRPADGDILFPVVTSVAPAEVSINLTAPPPAVVMACILKPRGVEFPCLEQVFQVAADGDTIEIRNCGVHLMRDSINIQNDITLKGLSNGTSKPIISRATGTVINTFGKVFLQGIRVKSLGGLKSKRHTEGGAAGVCLRAGQLIMSSCSIDSQKGTAVILDTSPHLDRFSIEKCTIGPCGRHGIVMDRCADVITVNDVEIFDIEMIGMAFNGGDAVITKCTMKNCDTGIKISGTDMKPGNYTLRDSVITNCAESAVDVYTGTNTGHRMITLTSCKIHGCPVAVDANGPKSKVLMDETNAIVMCAEESVCKDRAQIDLGRKPRPSSASRQVETFLLFLSSCL